VNVPVDRLDPKRRVFGNVDETDPSRSGKAKPSAASDGSDGGDPDLPCRTCPKRFMI
jgi:hypothetical protein